jgi:aminoglycoside phosphotransferase (APT) family kinase protein
MRPQASEWVRLSAALGLGRLTQIRLAARGSTHIVFKASTDHRAYAVRVPRTIPLAKRAQFSQRKNDLWVLAATQGIGPRYFGTQRLVVGSLRLHVSVTEWLDGRPFDPVHDARRLGETLARLHSQTYAVPGSNQKAVDLGEFLERWLDRQRRGMPPTALGEMLSQRLRGAQASLNAGTRRHDPMACLVHNDLVSQNVMVCKGQLRLIDWDWAMWTNPVMDLFCYLSPFVRSWERPFSLPRPAVARFLRSYRVSADARVITAARRGLDLWGAYNCGAAGWLYAEAPVRRRHFASRAFHEWAFGEAAKLAAPLREGLGAEMAP